METVDIGKNKYAFSQRPMVEGLALILRLSNLIKEPLGEGLDAFTKEGSEESPNEVKEIVSSLIGNICSNNGKDGVSLILELLKYTFGFGERGNTEKSLGNKEIFNNFFGNNYIEVFKLVYHVVSTEFAPLLSEGFNCLSSTNLMYFARSAPTNSPT